MDMWRECGGWWGGWKPGGETHASQVCNTEVRLSAGEVAGVLSTKGHLTGEYDMLH